MPAKRVKAVNAKAAERTLPAHCFEKTLKPRRYGVRERQIILKLHNRTPALLQDCASLSALWS